MNLLNRKYVQQILGITVGLYAVGARASLVKLVVGSGIGLYIADRFGPQIAQNASARVVSGEPEATGRAVGGA